jgi:hypothetical protein
MRGFLRSIVARSFHSWTSILIALFGLLRMLEAMVRRLPSQWFEGAHGVVSSFGNVPLIFLDISTVERSAGTHDQLARQFDAGQARCNLQATRRRASAREMVLGPDAKIFSRKPPRRPPANLDSPAGVGCCTNTDSSLTFGEARRDKRLAFFLCTSQDGRQTL